MSETAPHVEKQSKSFGATLRSPNGDVMRFTALRRKNGTIETFVKHTVRDPKTGEPSSRRGGTRTFTDETEARTRLDEFVKKGVDAGWTGARSAVKAAQPDAFDFDNLPKPGKGPAVAAKPKSSKK